MSGADTPHQMPPAVDSVSRRFAVTFVVNAVKLAIGVVAASIVPRALGPRDYGGFQFLTAAAATLRSFLDFGAASAAYTHAAKQRASGVAAWLYAKWLILQISVILAFILVASRLGLAPTIWPAQQLRYIVLITGLEWLTFAGTFLLQLGDAKAETVRVQKLNLAAQLVRLALLVILYAVGVLNLATFVLASYVTAAVTILAVLGGFVLRKRQRYFQPAGSAEERRECLDFFVSYARPLAVVSVAVFAHDFFDRWLLQTVSGSVQQAYFALAAQWGAIALLFTTSALNIVWREMSVANASGDVLRMQSIFRTTTRVFFLLSCCIAFVVAFNARSFVRGLAGAQYASAQPVTVLLAFYPVFQTLGQINGVSYYATARIVLYRNLTLAALAIGVVFSYVLVGPARGPIPGLQLGALGLALKQLLVNILSVTTLHAFNARFVRLSALREIGHLVGAAMVVASCSALASVLAGHLGLQNAWVRLAAMGCIQAALVTSVVYRFPSLVGLTRNELLGYLTRLRSRSVSRTEPRR